MKLDFFKPVDDIELLAVAFIVNDLDNTIYGLILNDGHCLNYYKCLEKIDNITNLYITDGRICCEGNLDIITISKYNENLYKGIVKKAPFIRDIQVQLANWKKDIESFKTVLQIEGSRQVGKTTEILKFAYSNYTHIMYVNCITDSKLFIDYVFNSGDSITTSLFRYAKEQNHLSFKNDKTTLLVIDEIQNSDYIYNRLRELSNDLECDIIVTGSYLARTLRKDFFLPAGLLEYMTIYPLSFNEFCKAFGKLELLESINFEDGDTISASVSKVNTELKTYYDLYLKIGGYPNIVNTYYKTNSIKNCYKNIEVLLKTVRDESNNYFTSPKDVAIFESVYTSIAKMMVKNKIDTGKNIGKNITHFVLDNINDIVNRKEIDNAIMWLYYCGMIGSCDLYNNADIFDKLPFRRIYFMDCGIASFICERLNFVPGDVTGILAENFIYTELIRLCNGSSEPCFRDDKPCFSAIGTYELDFMQIGVNGFTYGIEVKASSNSTKSLNYYEEHKLIDISIVVKDTLGGKKDNRYTIPNYAMTSFLKNSII